jgi:hypothetical protein
LLLLLPLSAALMILTFVVNVTSANVADDAVITAIIANIDFFTVIGARKM